MNSFFFLFGLICLSDFVHLYILYSSCFSNCDDWCSQAKRCSWKIQEEPQICNCSRQITMICFILFPFIYSKNIYFTSVLTSLHLMKRTPLEIQPLSVIFSVPYRKLGRGSGLVFFIYTVICKTVQIHWYLNLLKLVSLLEDYFLKMFKRNRGLSGFNLPHPTVLWARSQWPLNSTRHVPTSLTLK